MNKENEKENIATIILKIIFGLITFIILAFFTWGFYAVIIGAILVIINPIFQFLCDIYDLFLFISDRAFLPSLRVFKTSQEKEEIIRIERVTREKIVVSKLLINFLNFSVFVI